MKEIVSVSLGSSQRNSEAEVELGGHRLHVRRIGTDGDLDKARALIAELDGKVDCFGLGGGDFYLVAGRRRYAIKAMVKLGRAAKQSPMVDGAGFKEILEPYLLHRLVETGELDVRGKEVLLVSGVDRSGMARAFPELGAKITYGDLIFALGIPIRLRSYRALSRFGALLLPLVCRMPMSVIYPTGSKQESSSSKYNKYFEQADVIAGDFLYIRRYLPPGMDGRTVVTNTVRGSDLELLRAAGIRRLITTTPAWGAGGGSFGTNVVEAALVAISGRRPEELSGSDYLDLLQQLGLGPRVIDLQEGDGATA